MPILAGRYLQEHKSLCFVQMFKSSVTLPRCSDATLIQILHFLLPRKTEFPLKVFSIAKFLPLVEPHCLCKPSSLSFGQAVGKQEMSNCFLILSFELHTVSAEAPLKSLLPPGA